MDTSFKQRVLGLLILVAILGFCLTVLLRNTKTTQPHIAKINTQPFATQSAAPPQASHLNTLQEPIKSSTPTINQDNLASPSVMTPPSPTKTQTTVMSPSPVITNKQSVQTKPLTTIHPEPPTQAKAAPVSAKSVTPATTSKMSEMPVVPNPSTTSTASQEALFSQPHVKQTAKLPLPAASVHHHQRQHHVVAPPTSQQSKVPASLAGQKDLMVQVGTFSIAANAETLVDKLHAKGFSAVAQKINTSKGAMTRVIVGKKGLNYTQAETLRHELEKSMQLQGYLISHAKD